MNNLNQNYQRTIRFIVNKKLIPDANLNNFNWLKTHKNKLFNLAMSKNTLNTQKVWLLSIAKLMKETGAPEEAKRFNKEAVKIKEKLEKTQKDQKLTDKRLNEFVDYKTIIKKRNQLSRLIKKNKKNNLLNQQYLLLSLYTYIAPIRNNYHNTKIINKLSDDNGKNNFLLHETEDKYIFILNTDKVINHYGKIKIKFPKVLNRIIKESLKNFPRTYLFVNSKEQPMTDRNIASTLSNIFEGKKLSISNLRIAYITNFYSKNKTVNQKEKLAKQMRHSTNEALLSYQKVLNDKQKGMINIKRLKRINNPKSKLVVPRPNR
jgi:hypothetical protein